MSEENRLWHDYILPKLTMEQVTMFHDFRRTGGDVKVLANCALCGKELTTFVTLVGVAQCDWCWELEMRIRRTPDLARKVLERAREQGENAGGGTGTAPSLPGGPC